MSECSIQQRRIRIVSNYEKNTTKDSIEYLDEIALVTDGMLKTGIAELGEDSSF